MCWRRWVLNHMETCPCWLWKSQWNTKWHEYFEYLGSTMDQKWEQTLMPIWWASVYHQWNWSWLLQELIAKVQHQRDGWSTNDLGNHMKDIHEVKDNQPLSFNHVRCRGVAARAGSVHLMDRKLCRVRTRPHQHHPVPQGGPFSRKFWPTTRSPQTMPILEHSLVNTKRMSMTSHHTHFLHGWSKSTYTQQLFTHSLSSSQTVPVIPPGSSTSLTDWTGLEVLCQANGGGMAKVKCHLGARTLPLVPQLQKARPNLRLQSQHQLISAHMYCTWMTRLCQS